MKRLISIIILTQLTFLHANNYSLSFDGVDDNVSLINVYQFSGANDFTIGMWIYCEDLNSGAGGDLDGTVFLNTGGADTEGHLEIRFASESNGEMYARLDYWGVSSGGTEPNHWNPIENINENEWTHVSFTKFGNLITLYLNGIYNGEVTWGDEAAGAPASPYDWYLGWNQNEDPDDYYKGKMDNFMVWDYALSEFEIQATMDSELSGSETGLVGYWNFNEGTGTTLTDQTSNGNNGTISGATWSTDTPGSVTYYVATDGSDDNDGSENSPFATIQAGIDAASDGDLVLVQAGTYVENINYNGKNIVVQGENRETTIIDGNQNGSVVTFENGENSTAVLTGFNIKNGRAFGEGNDDCGGGIICHISSPKLENLIIENNRAGWGAGGVYFNTSSGELSNSIIRDNLAGAQGGGAYISSTSVDVLFNNVEITQNTVTDSLCCGSGAAVQIHYYSSAKFTNVTIANNTAISSDPRESPLFIQTGSSLELVNSIIWGNSPAFMQFHSSEDIATIAVSYSNIEGDFAGVITNNYGTLNWGSGNIDADPLFVNPDNGDYTLQSSSPCIDAGDPESDLDSDGSISDMGAYFYDQSPPPNDDNYSLSFDGVDDYVDVGNSDIFNFGTGDFSLECWYKSGILDGGFGRLIRKYGDSNHYYEIELADMGNYGLPRFNFANGNGQSYYAYGDQDIDNDQWNHLCGVRDGNMLYFYINGTLSGSTILPDGANADNLGHLTFGARSHTGGTGSHNVDDVRIWNVALTQTQIQSYMSTPPTGSESDLVGYWNFNEGSGTTASDATSNSNDGTIVGATWDEDGAPVEPNSIAALTVHEVDGGLGTTVSIPIDIDLMGIDISSTEIRFSGFQDHVNFIEVDTTGTLVGAAGWSIEVNEQEDLLLTLSYGASEISTNGTLFKLKFEIPEEVGVEFVPINITHAEMDELEGVIGITNGGISIQELLWGDVSQNGDVSGYDASFVLKYLVGTETLDETQLIVADVTQDATISALDATAIAQYVVEIIDELPVDATQNLSGGGEFVINEDVFSPGALLEIPVFLTGGNNLLSFEFDISYDSDIVTFENVEWSEMINHFTIEENTEDGSIRFAGMGTIPDGEEGIFATVSLFVSSDFNEESLDVTVNKSRINESEPIEDLVITFTNTALGVDANTIPKVYALRQNYPNPFNPTTQIKYDLPEDALVSINIYDLMGRSIKSLVNSNQSAGYRSIQWNATNNLGEPVSAGMYIYMIQADDFRQTKKMVLLK